MPKGGLAKGDQFSQTVYANVTQTVINTLTFQKLETGYGVLDKKGWVIEEIDWYPSANFFSQVLVGGGVAQAALCTSNLITSLTLQSAAVIDIFEERVCTSSAASFELLQLPIKRDFTNLTGGGLLVLPNPLYIAINSTLFAGGQFGSASCRIQFRWIDLDDNLWMDLVERTRLLT